MATSHTELAQMLRAVLDGPYAADKDFLREVLSRPVFQVELEPLPLKEKREVVLRQAKEYLTALQTKMDVFACYEDIARTYHFADVTGTCANESMKVKMGVQMFLFIGALLLVGNEDHHPIIKAAAAGEVMGCFAMTERDHGSNVRALDTEAVYDKDRKEFVIHTPHAGAEKWYIGNAGQHGHYCVVFAKLLIAGKDEGPHAFLVPIRDSELRPMPGVTLIDMGWKGGLNGVDNGRISFDHVRIPRSAMLSRYASVDETGAYQTSYPDINKRFYATLSAMTPTRLSLVVGSIGAMKRGLSIAIRYAHERRQFGPPRRPEVPIMTYTTHQQRLMPPLAMLFAINFCQQSAATRMGGNPAAASDREMVALCSGLKFMTTRATLDCLQVCRECCGGQGFMSENLLVGMRADQDICVTFDGDNTVLKQQVAKDLLDQYKRQFAKGYYTGMLSFLGTRISNMLKENVPSILHFIDDTKLCSQEWQTTLFSYFEGKVLSSLAMRLRARMQAGGERRSAFAVWNECLDHVQLLAQSHMERVLLESFIIAVNECKAEPARKVLLLLCNLFAVHCIMQHRDWYLEQGYFSKSDVKILRGTYSRLCAEVTAHSLVLVEAFAIPKVCLPAPIAHGVYARL